MSLNKLYYVYGLDTACFYNDEENHIEKKLLRARHIKAQIKQRSKKRHDIDRKTERQLVFLNQYINKYKSILKNMLSTNTEIRTVRADKIYDKHGNPALKRRAAIFDSTLIRCFELKEREFNTEIVIIKVYFFEVVKNIIKNGFYMNGQKYVFFSASAGQIRTKKLVAVREDLLKENMDRLTAGLTVESINAQGGMNVNKYIAYLALCNSATDEWKDFDIDRCIVVDDFENTVTGTVDFIDEKSYKITRQTLDLPFTQTDGCGMILPCLSDRNFMIRLPWVKGLLAKFDFIRFIKEHNASPIVTDVYGDKHDIIAENIQIIFTKSQFKMWKYYRDWNEYKDNFKKYHSIVGVCNVEEDTFSDSVINYQMIQTLSDLTDEQINSLACENNKDIVNLATDMNTMLKVFGAVPWNKNKTGFQKCLEKYPELISDTYSRKTLKDLKDKLERDLWSAKFKIGGKYTFVIPDLYAFCERLFLGVENPTGILRDGEVCCKLFDNGVKLDCLRSPHLYREHPIRVNNTDITWFDTNAIYISCHDFISRVVQCDFDGDKLLVTDNNTLITAAERNMQGIVPLYYNMGKASAEILTPDSLYKGLILAFNGGNIGSPSNDITKIWNSGEITQEKLDVIKWLCLEVNFTIDYAKTLYKPIRPDWVNDIIRKYTTAKVPHFFQYAKGKTDEQVESRTQCTVDRIKPLYPRKKLNFNFKINNIGKFDYKVLMHDPDIAFNEEIANCFKDIVSKLNFNNVADEKLYNYCSVYEVARQDILSLGENPLDIIDIIILDIFARRKTVSKKAFWTLFGDMVYINICNNLGDNCVPCKRCKRRFYRTRVTQVYCPKCKGYQKIGTKTLSCCDCGAEFIVDARNMTKIRCDNCQVEVDIKKNRQRVKRYFDKTNAMF